MYVLERRAVCDLFAPFPRAYKASLCSDSMAGALWDLEGIVFGIGRRQRHLQNTHSSASDSFPNKSLF